MSESPPISGIVLSENTPEGKKVFIEDYLGKWYLFINPKTWDAYPKEDASSLPVMAQIRGIPVYRDPFGRSKP